MSSLEPSVPLGDATRADEAGGFAAFLREALIVARYEVVSLLVTVRAALFFLTYGVLAGAVGAFYLAADEKTGGKLTELSNKMGAVTAAEKEEIVKQLGDTVGRPLIEALVGGSLPLLVLTVLLVSTALLPGLILLVGYSGISEDVHTRFSRYVLQRVRRGSWLAGKIAGHFAVTWVAVVVVHAGLVAYGVATDELDLAVVGPALPGIWLAMAVFVLGYVSYTALFSSVITPPFAAFAVGSIVLLVLWLFSFAAIGKFWMGTWDLRLWALDPQAIAVYVAHTLVFIGLAYLGLRRRDV